MVELKVIFHLPKASNVIGKKFLLKVELSAISGTYQSIASSGLGEQPCLGKEMGHETLLMRKRLLRED